MQEETVVQQNQKRDKYLVAFTEALPGIIDRINSAECGEEQVERLLKAMRFFGEGRLGKVICKEGESQPERKKVDSSLFSQPVKESGLSERAVRYLGEVGVKYLGEVFRISAGSSTMSVREIDSHLTSLNLSWNDDPLSSGWEPPYWAKDWFFGLLSAPLSSVIRPVTQRYPDWYLLNVDGIHTVGAWLLFLGGHKKRVRPGDLRKAKFLLRPQRDSRFHHAMYVPSDWNVPSHIPKDWQKEVERQKLYRKTFKEQITLELAEEENNLISWVNRMFVGKEQVIPAYRKRISGDYLTEFMMDSIPSERDSYSSNYTLINYALNSCGVSFSRREWVVSEKGVSIPETVWFLPE